MLAEGTPVDAIMEATGASRATVFRRQAALRDSPIPAPLAPAEDGPAEDGDGPPVAAPDPVDVGDPVAVATAAFIAGIGPLALANALGIDADALDADAADFGLLGASISRRRLQRLAARSDALDRMRRQRPAQWADWVAEQDAAERKAALDTRLPRDTWTAFFSALVAHQATILTERDMQDWILWVKELAIYRYPTMAE